MAQITNSFNDGCGRNMKYVTIHCTIFYGYFMNYLLTQKYLTFHRRANTVLFSYSIYSTVYIYIYTVYTLFGLHDACYACILL